MIIAFLAVFLTLILGTVCSAYAQSDLGSVLSKAKESLNTNKNQESKTDFIQSETETISSGGYQKYENSTYVTGSSSGIDLETSLLLARNEFRAYATVHNLHGAQQLLDIIKKEKKMKCISLHWTYFHSM